jgi:hypothetical protein
MADSLNNTTAPKIRRGSTQNVVWFDACKKSRLPSSPVVIKLSDVSFDKRRKRGDGSISILMGCASAPQGDPMETSNITEYRERAENVPADPK